MWKSCYLIKAGQGIRISFVPEVCLFSIQDVYVWEYAWDETSCWRRHPLLYSQPPKTHWSFSISRQLGQKYGETWVETWRYSGLPYKIVYQTSSSSELRWAVFYHEVHQSWWDLAGGGLLVMLACRPAAAENKKHPPERVSMAGLEVLSGKVEGDFPFFVRWCNFMRLVLG